MLCAGILGVQTVAHIGMYGVIMENQMEHPMDFYMEITETCEPYCQPEGRGWLAPALLQIHSHKLTWKPIKRIVKGL